MSLWVRPINTRVSTPRSNKWLPKTWIETELRPQCRQAPSSQRVATMDQRSSCRKIRCLCPSAALILLRKIGSSRLRSLKSMRLEIGKMVTFFCSCLVTCFALSVPSTPFLYRLWMLIHWIWWNATIQVSGKISLPLKICQLFFSSKISLYGYQTAVNLYLFVFINN